MGEEHASHTLLFNAMIYLLAAVATVPIAKRLGLGSVLGYLIAGVLIGPHVLGLIEDAEQIMHFAEFGVVLLLFLIGLELDPGRLWSLRKPILGIGGVQVGVTTLLLFAAGSLFGLPWEAALVMAMALSLSSTAIVLQILTEKGLLSTPGGSTSFSILLFQDIAVIPMLAIMPLIGVTRVVADGNDNALQSALLVIAVIVGIIIGGKFLIRPLFRIIAATRLREIFTAFSLLLVISIALLMDSVGMSMALGTFLAGVLLAESEYRHELESNIEPFKGLLLGLFFISVGMSIQFELLIAQPLLILGLVLGLVLIKMAVLLVLGRIAGIPPSQNPQFAFLLSQGGEFAFVLLETAGSFHILDHETAGFLTVTVALSMITTPLLMILYDRVIEPRYARLDEEIPEDEEIENSEGHVIIAGFGRFGQIVARLLHASKIPTTIIDHDPSHIERVRKFGFKVFYGDITRIELLHAAGAGQARLFILAIDDREAAIRTVELLHTHFPGLTIMARAWDMIQVYELLDHGVHYFERETFKSALHLGEQALRRLGFGAYQSRKAALKFKKQDMETLWKLYEVHKDETQIVSISLQAREELEKLFEADEIVLNKGDDGWR